MSVIFIDGAPFIDGKSVPGWSKLIAAIVLIATVIIAVRKETYLPFLGPSAIPSVAIRGEFVPEGANLVMTVDLKERAVDGDKVLYWAANESLDDEPARSPWKAYKGFHNCGVAIVRDGQAILRLKCPSKYKVGFKTLDKHVHYRIIPTKGVKLLGEVQTTFVNCKE